ncbi:MAG TPA: hypothetical protein DSN98_05045 [Thermoplasmata archaeon]|nr:MAG TPA: hypothetical protein DSN98_05045 [Thermoplasmata archaeon]
MMIIVGSIIGVITGLIGGIIVVVLYNLVAKWVDDNEMKINTHNFFSFFFVKNTYFLRYRRMGSSLKIFF